MSGDPASNPPVTSMRYEGAYVNTKHYAEGDVVTDGGASFVCTEPTVGHAPPNVRFWDALPGTGAAGAVVMDTPNTGGSLLVTADDPSGIALVTSDPAGGILLETDGGTADVSILAARAVSLSGDTVQVNATGVAPPDGINIASATDVSVQAADPGGQLSLFGAQVAVGGPGQEVGFFGAAPVVQPAIPVTLGDVITGLQALGLFAS